jgi:hypothetical protein
MLRVTVELVPFGIEEEAREIGKMLIANDGTGNSLTGHYVFTYNENDQMFNGIVVDFPRSMGAWELIANCLGTYDIVTEDHEFEILKRLEERFSD